MVLQLPKTSMHRRGFTLMEVLVVLVLVGILTALATVGWQRFTWQVRVRGALDDLRNAIQLARSDATTRKRSSGILIDQDSLRYLRFVDSSSTGESNGRYDAGEFILQPWTKFPSRLVFFDVQSSIQAILPPRKCDQLPSATLPAHQHGTYSIVFKSDGSSMATFQAKLGIRSFPDTFHLNILPPTGWVMLEK